MVIVNNSSFLCPTFDCGILTVLQVTVMTLVIVQAMVLPSCPLVSVNLVTTPFTQLWTTLTSL